MVSDAKKDANARWDAHNMTILGCKVRKDYADRVRKKAKDKGTSVNAILKKALDDFMEGDK